MKGIQRTVQLILGIMLLLPCLPRAQALHIVGDSLFIEANALVYVEGDLVNADQGGTTGRIFNSGDIEITGNWTNNSILTVFSAFDPGTTTFLGNNVLQTIGGTGDTYFNNLTIDKPNGVREVRMLRNSLCDGVLNLNNDYLQTQAFVFGVANSAVNAVQRAGRLTPPFTDAIDSGFVWSTGAGYLARNTLPGVTYLFPTGNTTRFRPVEITSTALVNSYGVRFVDAATPNTANRAASLNTINPNYYHKLYRGIPAIATENISIYYDFVNDGVCDINNVTMAEYDGATWQDLGPTVSANNTPFLSVTTKNSYPGSYPTPFNTEDFVLAGNFIVPGVNSCVFPVELLNLRAQGMNDYIRVSWETASENNNAGFEVHRSLDGIDFEYLAWVDGAGTTSDQQQYGFNDRKVQPGQLYHYRLRQLDLDGHHNWTDIVQGIITTDEQFEVSEFYPNPSSGASNLWMIVPEASTMNFKVFNSLGQIIHQGDQEIQAGYNELSFNFEQLARGPYYAILSMNNQSVTRKLVLK